MKIYLWQNIQLERKSQQSNRITKQKMNNVKLSQQEQIDTYRKYKQRKAEQQQNNETEKEESTRYPTNRTNELKG